MARFFSHADALQTRRDRCEELEAERYNALYEVEDDKRRRKWEGEFDTIPYRSNGAEIHRAVMLQLGQRG
jgi:hypothetical protein